MEDGTSVTYGDEVLRGFLPRNAIEQGRVFRCSYPSGAPPVDPTGALISAVEAPLPSTMRPLDVYLSRDYGDGRVAVVVDDHTRPNVHTRLLLPMLLDWLLRKGVERESITLVAATGTHRPPTQEEWRRIVGSEVWNGWNRRMEAHDCDSGLVTIAGMADGTPLEMNGLLQDAEVLLPLSDLDYHYFAGVSGGPKQLIPGLAGRRIITQEHLQMFGDLGFHDRVDMGIIEGNPVYRYKLEAIRKLLGWLEANRKFLYAVTTVMNPKHECVHISGGDILQTHRAARKVLDAVYVGTVERPADVVIISARHLGLNLYQAGKAINAARRVVKSGGHILVLAPCLEGWGNESFRKMMELALPYLKRLRSIPEGAAGESRGIMEGMLREVQREAMRDYVIGKQKPVDLLVTLMKVGWGHLWLLQSGFASEDQATIPMNLLTPNPSASEALRGWVERREAGARPTYLVVDDPTLLLRTPERQNLTPS